MRNNVNIQLYSSCNCDCSFCSFKDKKHNKISPSFVLDFLDKNPHINYIVITGGEPTFAIDEYKEIVTKADLTQKKVVFQTNGWWADNDKIKEILKECPPSLVQISVDYEKQKIINIDTVIKSYRFLKENNIKVLVINHTNDRNEYDYYANIFEDIARGVVCVFDGEHYYDCGTSLLATNEVGKFDILGWRTL